MNTVLYFIMSDADEKILSLEREYNSLFENRNRERRHRRYFNIGSIIGIIFIFVSTPYEKEFYTFFGTLGMGIIQGLTGLCVLMSVLFLLPGVRAENDRKWEEINILKKKIDKMKKK